MSGVQVNLCERAFQSIRSLIESSIQYDMALLITAMLYYQQRSSPITAPVLGISLLTEYLIYS